MDNDNYVTPWFLLEIEFLVMTDWGYNGGLFNGSKKETVWPLDLLTPSE